MLRVSDGNKLLGEERTNRCQQRGDEIEARLGWKTGSQDCKKQNDGAVLQAQRQQVPA